MNILIFKIQFSLTEFIRIFHAEHKIEFSYDIPERNIEIVNCRLEAIGKTHKPSVKESSVPKNVLITKETRNIYFGDQEGWRDTAVYERKTLPSGEKLLGPAVIEEMSSTTIIPSKYQFIMDPFGNLIMEAIL